MFLVYGGNSKAKLRVDCYCDARSKTDRDDIKSQTRYTFILNGGAVDWKSSKQSTTTMSATKAEDIAALEAAMKAVWIRKFISGLGIVPTINEPIKMFCDNLAALLIANKPRVQKGARHYHRRYHCVRELIMTKVIKEEFEKLESVKISNVSLTYNTSLEIFNKEFIRMSRMVDDLFTYEVEIAEVTNIPCDLKKEDDSEQQMSHESNDYMEYDPSDVEFTVARGDDEVELTDEESSNSDDEDEVAKIFKIKTNVFDIKTPLCRAFIEFNYLLQINPDVLAKDTDGLKTYEEYKDDWIYEWNKDVPYVYERPWMKNGVRKEPTPVKHHYKPFDNNKWYNALKDTKLKEEALKNKAIIEGMIDEDEESSNEGERKPKKGQNRIKTGQKREASSSKLSRDQTTNLTSSMNPNPKGQIRRSSKQKVENSHFEEHLTPVATMTDNRTMAEMLRAPTEGCAEAIVVPPILAEQFELKHSLINMITSEQFFGLEKDNPDDHIRWGSPPMARKRTPQKFNECFHEAWESYKDLLRGCPHHCFTELHQLDTSYNALNPADQDSLNAAAGGNFLEKSPQDALTIIENKYKVRNSQSKPIASPLNACDINSSSEIAKLTHAVNQQTSAVTTALMAMLKQLQENQPPAQVKAVEEICVTYRGAYPYYQCVTTGGNTFPEIRDNIQGYVSATASNYNQGNPGYRPQGVANQMRPPGFAQPNVQNNQNQFGQPQGFNRGINFNQEQPYQATTQSNQNFHLNELEKIKRMNDVSLKAMQNQIDMVKNELRNEMKTSIQTSLSNQTNEIKNIMASLLQINTASTSGSGSLPGNTVANPKGELKAITTRSGLVTDVPTVPTPLKSVTPEEDECVEETYTDPDLAEYTIKVPPHPVQKEKPPIQRHFVLHTRDSPPLNIPYPSRMLKQKQQEKDDIQIQKFWNMFKQLHLNITLDKALVLMPKYQKMLKALLSNKEKL
nr:putative retrotransposon protein [Tanacetum cinerariifolium]